ncbi:MAG: alpha-amylase family glycosyl hydrolase [Termitinemataceae bacterium]|nr:MAG: alpha-amylase family glycosyl hydrolase [Termitinemataceae bacterium]
MQMRAQLLIDKNAFVYTCSRCANRFMRFFLAMPFVALQLFVLWACEIQPTSEAIPSLGGRNEGTWYEIFTISYADSNGDGSGDFNGIADKLDYLNDTNTLAHRARVDANGFCDQSLHIDGLWLTPIMPSPSYHKYDTKDYKNVDATFGSITDFQNLLQKCHEHDIKLIIDLVLNHSSQDHPWFQKALEEVRSGNPGRYASYYNFFYGTTPPGWETTEYKWSDTDNKWYISGHYYKFWAQASPGVWYEGSFWTGMPDLNWDSEYLREELHDIVKFWLGMGLDGFRLDATSWVYDFYTFQQVKDEYYDGINVTEKNISMWTWFNNTCKEINPNVYLVGECWKDGDEIVRYYRSGMNFFAFNLMYSISDAVKQKRGDWWSGGLVDWEHKIKMHNPSAMTASFLSNHDQWRSYHNFDNDEQRKMAASMNIMAPGTPWIYYGEEIGLANHFGDKGVHEDYDQRGPMWWSNTNKDQIPNVPDGPLDWPQKAPPSGQGVEEQLTNPGSMLRYYIQINNCKNIYPWIKYGYRIQQLKGDDDAICAYRVTNPDNPDQTAVVIHNTDSGSNHSLQTKNLKPENVHGFSMWGDSPAHTVDGWVLMPPYSTGVVLEELD